MMNITEFAKAAGVSKAAVSRYFNGGYLSEEKRARIAAAVEATGYRPSGQAQMLRTRRTRQVGVVLPKLSSESCARMVDGISQVLGEQGYQLLLMNTANDYTKEEMKQKTYYNYRSSHAIGKAVSRSSAYCCRIDRNTYIFIESAKPHLKPNR